MPKISQIEVKINARIQELQVELAELQNNYNKRVLELQTLETILKQPPPKEPPVDK